MGTSEHIRSSGSMSTSEHIRSSLKIVDESEESSMRGLLVGSILNKGGLERLKETFHFVNNDGESVTINSRSNLHEGSNRISFTNMSQLSESGGGGLWTERSKSW